MNKHYSKKKTYRITYTANGLITDKLYMYIGRDKYKQIIFRPLGMNINSEHDIALYDTMKIGVFK